MKKLTIFKQKKEFRWHLTASNGRIIAESGESYKRKSTMLKSIKSVFDGKFKIVDKTGQQTKFILLSNENPSFEIPAERKSTIRFYKKNPLVKIN